jgi:hypothetical protein
MFLPRQRIHNTEDPIINLYTRLKATANRYKPESSKRKKALKAEIDQIIAGKKIVISKDMRDYLVDRYLIDTRITGL